MLGKGFTLVELMIVILIIGILSAVALPAYNQFVQDGRRTDVQQTLLQHVALLEKQYTRLGGYPDSSSISATDYYTFSYSPSSAAAATSATNDSTTFLLTATPISTSGQSDDECGALSVNHQGEKLPNQKSCWGK